jgi:hypothetical protein
MLELVVGTAVVEVEVVAAIAAMVGAALEGVAVLGDPEVAAVEQLQPQLVEVVDQPRGASRVLLQPLGGPPGSCSKISLLR